MTIYDAIERIAIFEKASPKMKSKIIRKRGFIYYGKKGNVC